MKSIEEISRRQFTYQGVWGLEVAQAELQQLKRHYNRLPKTSDKGMGTLFKAIKKGSLAVVGIDSWNSLLRLTFGDTNKDRYKGDQGFQRIIKKLKQFFEMTNRLPMLTDPGMAQIKAAIQRGVWQERGITTWNKLLSIVFGEVNVELGKYQGKKGLEEALFRLQHFEQIHGRLPKSTDQEVGGIHAATKRGLWEIFGIDTWNDLLQLALGQVNVNWGLYRGNEGLKRAMNDLQKFHQTHNRFPVASDYQFGTIRKTAERGEWAKQKITSWNELLRETFGDIGVSKEMNIYTGEKGLERAITELKEFKQSTGKLPRSDEFKSILAALGRGEWTIYNIHTWNALLNYIFNEVNSPRGKYTGLEGLEQAKQILKDFHAKYLCLPTTRDRGFGGIKKALSRGEWADQGIMTWNQLLAQIFSKVNTETGKYTGSTGLTRAIQSMKTFQETKNRLPSTKDKEMQGITSAAYRGEWVDQGIHSWNDLMKKVFNQVNTNQYSGKDGLTTAMNVLRHFKQKYNRYPKLRDQEMKAIVALIYKGKWKVEGIATWNDLLRKTFNKVNRQPGKYNGKKGLFIAMQEIRAYKAAHSKVPTSKTKEMRGILTKLYAKEWAKYHITSWRDLIQYTFHSTS